MRSKRVWSEQVLPKQVVVVGGNHWRLREPQWVLHQGCLRHRECSLWNLESKLHRVLEHGHLRHSDLSPWDLDDFVLWQDLFSQANSIGWKSSELISYIELSHWDLVDHRLDRSVSSLLNHSINVRLTGEVLLEVLEG